MQTLTSNDNAVRQARKWYDQYRTDVETPENIGKMIVIDVESGRYGIDATGFDASRALRQQNKEARLVGLRIGYDVAAALGGVMERTAS